VSNVGGLIDADKLKWKGCLAIQGQASKMLIAKLQVRLSRLKRWQEEPTQEIFLNRDGAAGRFFFS